METALHAGPFTKPPDLEVGRLSGARLGSSSRPASGRHPARGCCRLGVRGRGGAAEPEQGTRKLQTSFFLQDLALSLEQMLLELLQDLSQFSELWKGWSCSFLSACSRFSWRREFSGVCFPGMGLSASYSEASHAPGAGLGEAQGGSPREGLGPLLGSLGSCWRLRTSRVQQPAPVGFLPPHPAVSGSRLEAS